MSCTEGARTCTRSDGLEGMSFLDPLGLIVGKRRLKSFDARVRP